MNQIRKRLTYANVMSTLAVFLLLGSATALAASQLGKHSVGTRQLKGNAVTAAKIRKNAVTTAKIRKAAVTGAKISWPPSARFRARPAPPTPTRSAARP